MAQPESKPEVVTAIKGPKILPFLKPRPKTNAECVADEFMKEAKRGGVVGVVIAYQKADGSFSFMSDQGDDAGVNYFIDRAKMKLLSHPDETPPAQTVS